MGDEVIEKSDWVPQIQPEAEDSQSEWGKPWNSPAKKRRRRTEFVSVRLPESIFGEGARSQQKSAQPAAELAGERGAALESPAQPEDSFPNEKSSSTKATNNEQKLAQAVEERFTDETGQQYVIKFRAVERAEGGIVWIYASGPNRNEVWRNAVYPLGHRYQRDEDSFRYVRRASGEIESFDPSIGFVVRPGDELISPVSFVLAPPDSIFPNSPEQESSEDTEGSWLPEPLQWVWGVLQGDFNEDPSTSQIIANGILTAIPGLDQIGDARDLAAAAYKLAWEQRYDEIGPWIDLFLTAIGLIPSLGSALKGVVRLLLKTPASATLRAVRQLLGPWADILREIVQHFPRYADDAARQAKQIASSVASEVARVADVLRGLLRFDPTGQLGKLVTRLDELNRAFGEVLSRIDDKFREFGEEIQRKLDELLGGNGQLAPANGAPLSGRRNQADDLETGQPMQIEGGGTSRFSRSEVIANARERIGTDFKNHPLRAAYEEEVGNLSNFTQQLREQDLGSEEIARRLHQARRELGEKYKDATPWPLRDYIYQINRERYGDPLGPTFDYLLERYASDYERIISAATRPNPDINRLLSSFEDWLRTQDDAYIRRVEQFLIGE